MNIVGANGVKMSDAWANKAKSYLGLLSRGFPNMLMTTGPVMTAGNAPVLIQNNVDFFVGLIEHMEANGIDRVDVDEQAEDEWTAAIEGEAARSVGASYAHPDVAWKRGTKTFSLGHLGKFRQRLIEIQEAGFEGLVFEEAPAREASA